MNNYNVYIVSDSIGETAEQVIKAAISQFNNINYEIKRFSYISDEDQVDNIIDEAKDEKSIIVFTLVYDNLKNFLIKKAKENNITIIDLMTPIINVLSDLFNDTPIKEPGVIRRLDDKYFKRVEAVEFAVKYDDGKNIKGLRNADLILLGVSRTSKTPLSMYLAHKNIKVANVPLVPEVSVPDELYKISNKKIIGLTTNPVKLNEIRLERLKALGLRDDANYASMKRIFEEIEYAEKIMKKVGCPIIDVANKAVEETANIIFEIINL